MRRDPRTGWCRPLTGDEPRSGKLDSFYSCRRAEQQSGDPVATRSHATHSRWRSESRSEGAALDLTFAPRAGCHTRADLFSARGGGPSRRLPRDRVLLAGALDARPSLHVVARTEATRSRGSFEWPFFRSFS